jgi:hypothetical protein
MNNFEKGIQEANNLYRNLGRYGNCGRCFPAWDVESIYLFTEALKSVKDVDIEETYTTPDKDFVFVNFNPKTNIAYAICRAILDHFSE